MKIISSSNSRKYISNIIADVRETGRPVVIARYNEPEVVIVKFPREYKKDFSEISNLNAYSTSFDFLKDEPDLYSRNDLKQ
jgi:hypothetical protein